MELNSEFMEFSKNYYDLLTGEYKGINLTRITDFEEFVNKQIIDSIKPFEVSTHFKKSIDNNELFIDVGFGGGFPILPMARLLPDKTFIGFETRGKKAKVVSEIATKLGLKNVFLFHRRIEEVLIDKGATITLKAVGKVHDFLELIHFSGPIEPLVFFYKGPGFYQQEKEQLALAKAAGWKVIEEKEVLVPGTEKRLIVGFQPVDVPRGTKAKKGGKLLVKLSDLMKNK